MYGPSLSGLDGFYPCITGLPYAAEEIDISGGRRTLYEAVCQRLKQQSGLVVLNEASYQGADKPGKLDITVEYKSQDEGTVLHLTRAYVTQLAVLERDLDAPKRSPVITWLSPQAIIGETSPQLLYQAIERNVLHAVDQFIDHYRQACE
jgi:hypothetical protein